MKSPLDSRQLLAFLKVAEHNSFTHAARDIFLTQSAISHSLRALEDDLGCRLLSRVGKKVTLTPAGEQFLHHARKILGEMSAARDGLEQLKKWGQTRLRLIAPGTICATLLPNVLRELKSQFPRCLISVEPGDSQEAVSLLDSRTADLAVTLEPRTKDAFEFIPLFSDEIAFLVSAQHRWAKLGHAVREEIPTQNVIVYGRGTATWRMIESYFKSEDITLNTVLEFRNTEAIKELVKLDIGISLLAPWVAQREIQEGALVAIPIGRRKLRRQWGVLHHRQRTLTLPETTFIDLLRKATPSLPTLPNPAPDS